jgi:hypothetical protein
MNDIQQQFQDQHIQISDNKYFKWYCNIINKRLTNPYIASKIEKHHIIPKCIGGIKLVHLSLREHFIVHLLLTKFTSGKFKYQMINAFFSMSKHDQVVSSRTYKLYRRVFIDSISGSNNPSCSGIYHTPWGSYDLLQDCIDGCSTKITKNTIIKYCYTKNDVIITKHMIMRSPFLQSVESLGSSFNSLGFNFEPKKGYTPNVSFNIKGASVFCKSRDVKLYTTSSDYHSNRRMFIDYKDINNTNWKGYYHINNIKFDTAKSLSEYTGLSRSFISTLFKGRLHHMITKRQAESNKWLKTLPFNSEGMSYHDLGFRFTSND